MTTTVSRARAQIADASLPATGGDFAGQVMQAVHGALGYDGFCLLGLDPDSGIRSFMFCRDGVGDPRQLAHNEWEQRDLHRYVDLGRATVPVGVLRDDRRELARSPRLQEILRPAGVSSELRLALRGQGRLWGAVVLFREGRGRPFDDDDVATALELAGPLAQVVRRYPVRVQRASPDARPAGVVVLADNDDLVSITEPAWGWLAEAVEGGLDEDRPGRVHRAVYEVARAARSGAAEPISRIRTAGGRWLAISAAPLEGTPGHVAVVLSAATVQQVIPAAAGWYGLTPREREALTLVAAGTPAKSMAMRMGLSTHTLNDHLTSIYRKAGVRGKDELLAQISGTTLT